MTPEEQQRLYEEDIREQEQRRVMQDAIDKEGAGIMTTTQMFDNENCMKHRCEKYRFDCCFGIPENCKINKKG